MRSIWRQRPSPAMVVAMVALFAALTGTAVGLSGRNSVTSKDIKHGAVHSKDIHKRAVQTRKLHGGAVTTKKLNLRAVTPPRADFVKSASAPGAVATSSRKPVGLPGGPSATVTVPAGGLVAVYAQAALSVTGQEHKATVRLFAPGLLRHPPILESGSNTLVDRYTSPGESGGVSAIVRGSWIVFPAPPGKHTFALAYQAQGGTATFAERKLYVSVAS